MASSQRPFYIALAVVVAGGAYFIYSRMTGTSAPSMPANITVTPADTSGFQGYTIGSPSAPVLVTEFAAYTCPYCANFDAVWFPDLKTRLIDTGKARFRFRDFPLGTEGEHRWSRVAALAAACANDQGHFWDVKGQIFARQHEWATGNNPMPVLRSIASGAQLDMSRWDACMKSAKYAGRIEASWQEGNKLGVNSTPTFLIGGRLYTLDVIRTADAFVKLVDSVGAATVAPAAGAPSANGGR
ncbi:MAG: DsbA family protein [Gemmatimonadales bacterium]